MSGFTQAFVSAVGCDSAGKLFIRTTVVTAVLLISLLRPCSAATIILDPGHGGDDSGAKDGAALTEKEFTLALALQIADRLADRHRVELTRSTDIAVPPDKRAAMANHLQADLMVSLHAAVGPYCNDRSAAIYYHSDERLAMPPGLSMQNRLDESDADRPAWDTLQSRHQHQSRHLADTMKQVLLEEGSFDHVRIDAAPLVALMGADLPAVLIEVGCMHPSAAVSHPIPEHEIKELARALADAIESAAADLMR